MGAIDDYRRPQRMIRQLGWMLTAFVALSIALLFSTVVLWRANRRANSLEGVKQNLGAFDGEIFAKRKGEEIRVARAFPDRDALDKASSLKEQFMAA